MYILLTMNTLDNSEKWELTFKITGDNLTKEEKKGNGGLRHD